MFLKNHSQTNIFETIDRNAEISLDDIGLFLQQNPDNISKIHAAANDGNFSCQVFLSQMGVELLGAVEEDPSLKYHTSLNYVQALKNFEHFTKLAAEQGDADSQFNLAQYYIKKVDISNGELDEEEISTLRNAKYWYDKALSNGRKDAKEIAAALAELFSQ